MKLLYSTVTSIHMLKFQHTVKFLQIQIWDFKHYDILSNGKQKLYIFKQHSTILYISADRHTVLKRIFLYIFHPLPFFFFLIFLPYETRSVHKELYMQYISIQDQFKTITLTQMYVQKYVCKSLNNDKHQTGN